MKQFTLFDIQPAAPAFYNTIQATTKLPEYESKALSQEQKVMKVFESGEKLTALEVRRRTGMNQDSCKRAITNLKKKGKLIKLEEMVMEEYGKPNHLWQSI